MGLRRIGLGVVTAGIIAFVTLHAQIPGRNVNMVSGTGWPMGDPFLQKQNEPSVAASSRNPLHLLGGSNDYRSVDVPGLLGIDETGDAWLGLFKSFDGGQRWTSTLLPGYLHDPRPEALTSPLKGYQAGADPVVRAGTSGMFYFNGLVFDRVANGKSAIFVARFIDSNHKETGDPIQYLGASLVASATGANGVSYDKPWMAVDRPRSGAGTCRIVTPGDNGTTITQTIPAGNVYVAFTSISGVGVNTRSQIYFTRSTDCGVTWSTPVRISRIEDPINQGATIAIDPRNGSVYVAWRRFGLDISPESDSVVVVRSLTQGRSFERPNLLRRLQEIINWLLRRPRTPAQLLKLLERIYEHRFAGTTPTDVDSNIAEFDQVGSEAMIRFRTNAYPTMTFDGNGRLYIAWSERGYATPRASKIDGDARIVMTTTTDAATFTPTFAVNDVEIIDGQAVHSAGHQIMPTLAFAGGKLMLVYYDLRESRAGFSSQWIDDKTAIDTSNPKSRHTIDIRAVMGTPGASPAFLPSVKVSDYIRGVHPDRGLEDLQANPPNLPMFKLGTVPFIGDYIDVQPAPAFISLGNGTWAHNTATTATLPMFHAVWTDNRDVRTPLDFDWKNYTPPTFAGPSPLDPTRNVPQCFPGSNPGSRNQNIYSARITGGLLVGSPGNSKQLSPTLQRSFVVFVQNNTLQTRAFRLTIANQPVGGRASFTQFPQPPYGAGSPPPVAIIDAGVPPRSTASRTVYVTSSDPRARVNVNVEEIGVGGPPPAVPLTGVIVLNPDLANPDLANPDYANPDYANPDLANAEVGTPDLANPDLANPDLANFLIMTPDLANPDLANVVVANPDLANPDLANPDLANPDLANPDLANPDLANPDLANGTITDISWQLQNRGNTTAAFNVNLFLAQENLPAGLKVQLILRKVYTTPVAVDCNLKFETRNILVANILNPVFLRPSDPSLPSLNDPSEKNGTILLAPGEIGKITLRVGDDDKSNNILLDPDGPGPLPPASIDPILNPITSVTPVVRTQSVPTEDVAAGQTTPELVTPTGTHVLFVQPPVNVVPGTNMFPPVAVQVRNGTGTVIPNATVTLEFENNPNGAILSGNVGLTNAQGIAVFPNLQIDRLGFGYSLKATATVALTGFSGSGMTNLFAVTEACVATGVTTLQRYHVDGPAWPDRPKLIKSGVDWNQDGLEDVVVVSNGGTFYTMPNVAGGFSAGYLFASPTGLSGAADVATGDFNGDGAPDVAVAKGTQNTVVFQPLALGLPSGSQVVTSVGDHAIRLATGDFNNDTRLDLAVLRAASVRILWGDDTGNFPTTFDDLTGPGLSLSTAIATLDLDGDDDLDLVVADSPGAVGNIRIFRNHPTGVFTAMAPRDVGNTPVHLAVKDFNSDGYPDIAVAHAGSNDVRVLFGDAAGAYAVSTVVSLGFVPGGLTAGDYNSDGVADIAVTHTTADALLIWFGRHGAPFTFTDPRSFVTDPQPIGITTGDFNNDGRSDLATANGSAGSVDDFNTMSVLLGSCGAQTADLEVSQTESADPVAPSSQISYTATVTNHGPFPATNVRLVHDATSTGPNLIWQGAVVTPQGSCEIVVGGPTLICDLGTLAPGASATVQSLFQASGPGLIRSVFVATAAEVDLAPDNNRDAETTTVHDPAYIVTTPADAGAGSLRQAILDANAHPGPDIIRFNLPNAPPHTITPLSALPAITDALLIDAPVTGDCAGAPPTIEIDGISAGAASGLVGAAAGITIRGLSITRFAQYGIALTDGGVVECSYLGVSPTGAARGNTLGGISLAGSGNTVGGATSAVRNVISANAGYGVRIEGPGGNFVQGNFIGTNAAGTAAIGNGAEGVSIYRSPNNTIGGLTAAPGIGVGNVISGNTAGVAVIGHLTVAGNVIQGNIIGLAADGTTDLGNVTGVQFSAAGAQVGGAAAGARNIISGNNFGIVLSNSGSTFDTFIEGNYIGTDITGTLDRGNSTGVTVGSAPGTRVGGTAVGAGNVISGNQVGVYIHAISHPVINGTHNALVQGNLIGVNAAKSGPLGNITGVRIHNNNNQVGGTVSGAANTIAHNSGNGVEVRFGTGASILSNAIYGNAGLGIDLNDDGPTANDPGDADAGPNLSQNYPVITSARMSGATTGVSGALRSTPNTQFTIQVFANNSSEAAQGRRLLDTLTQTTDAGGFATFALAPAIALGEVITATATDPVGNTSEFSPGVETVTASPFAIAIDTTPLPAGSQFVVESSGSQVVGLTPTGGVTKASLLPGSYTFHAPWSSPTAAFDFLVTGAGSIDFSPALDGFVIGRGSQTLVVAGRAVIIDTSGMKPRHTNGLTRALVVSSFNNNSALRYNGQTGTPVDALSHASLAGSGGVAYGPDGHLYVAGQTTHNILRFDGDTGAFIDEFVPAGSGGLSFPTGLTFGRNSGLYVSSLGTHEVLKYNDTTGAFVGAFVAAGSGGLDKPIGTTFGPDGRVYVASSTTDSILRYHGDTGAFLDAFVPAGSGGLDSPAGLTFGPDGNLYVASGVSDSILRYDDATGAFINAFVGAGSAGLNDPIGVTFGPDSNLYVATGDRVVRYNGTTGAFVDVFVPSGTGGLSFATFMAFRPGPALPNPGQYLVWSGDSPAIAITFSGDAQHYNLLPGDYTLSAPWSSVSARFDFTIRPSGTFDFAPTIDSYVSGRGTSALVVSGHPITFDTKEHDPGSQFIVWSANPLGGDSQAVGISPAGSIITAGLLPGSYRFSLPWASTTTAFDFTVSATGTIDFAPALDGYVTGRGTATLRVLGHPIGIDTTGFDPGASYIVYSGGTPAVGITAAGSLKPTHLMPGSYSFFLPWASNTTAFDFTVSTTGTIDFAPALDGYVSGRGTGTLTVSGHPIGINTTGFDSGTSYTVYSGGAPAVGITAAGSLKPTRLLPGSYRFHIPWASNTTAFDFTVSAMGTIDFAPSLDGYVSGRGTNTLRVLGHPIEINTTGFDPGTSYTVYSGGAPAVGITAAGSLKPTRLLPGNYSFHLPWASNTTAFDFTVSATGTIDFDPSLDGYVSGRGTSTLTVSGHPIGIDTTGFDPGAAYTVYSSGAPAVGITAAGSLKPTRLLPGNYSFYLPWAANSTVIDFTVSVTGAIDFAPALDGYVSGRGTSTLDVNGWPITIDTSALSSSTYTIWAEGAVAVGATATGGAVVVRLLPGSYLFDGPFDFTFIVLANGTLDFSAAFEPDLEGRGTNTLTVNNDPNTDADDGLVVTTTADSGAGSLRQAILDANARSGLDTITFHIPGTGAFTMTPASALPALIDPVIIDGTTQPGFEGAPRIAISGAVVPGASGLRFNNTATGSTVRGLAIHGFSSSDAIALFSGDTVVEGNYLGVNLAGTGALANLRGIRVESSANHIGGSTFSQRNVISGNNIGIEVIGGSGNTIVGNYIGTNAGGTAALPNAAGIQILVPGTIVGGFVPNDANIISGNSGSGILVGTGVTDAFIRANVIGRSTTDLPLGNGAHGIRVLNATGAYMAANTIAHNGQDGISVEGTTTGAFVDGNSIYGNGGLGVDLGNDGVTANDAGDGDTGPNNRQNFPVLTGAQAFPDALVVDGNLNSAALKAFQIFVYWSPACDGEGAVFVGDHIVSTNAVGNVTFSIVVPAAPGPGGFVTTIAASSDRNSSEFSACIAVP